MNCSSPILRYLLPMAIALCPCALNAEKTSAAAIDSLTSALKTCIQDTSRINIYNQLCWEHQDAGKFDEGLPYGEKALALSEKINNTEKQADSYNRIGEIYRMKGNYRKAIESHYNSLKISENSDYHNGKARALKNIGVVYYHLKEFEDALASYFKAAKIYESIRQDLGLAHCYHNIAVIYARQKHYEKSLNYFEKVIQMKARLQDKKGLAAALIRTGSIHTELLVKSGQNKTSPDTLFNTAKSKFDAALSVSREIGYIKGIINANIHLGSLFLARSDVATALGYFNKGLQDALQAGSKEFTRNAYSGLYKANKLSKNFQAALNAYTLFVAYNDSLINEENRRFMYYQQAKYEFEKAQFIKEQEEAERARQEAATVTRRNNLQYSGIGFGMLMLMLLIVLFARFHVRSVAKAMERRRPVRILEAAVFIAFLVFFEFILVLTDPYIDGWTGGAPAWKLLINAALAGIIFPVHSFFEGVLKKKLIIKPQIPNNERYE